MVMDPLVPILDSVSGEAQHSVEKVVKVITTINLIENYSEDDPADEDGGSGKQSAVHLLVLLLLSLSGNSLEHVKVLTGGRGRFLESETG